MWPFKSKNKLTSDAEGKTKTQDALINHNSGQGTERDIRETSFFRHVIITRKELENAYRFDWLSRAVIDYPINDMLKPWRTWDGKYENPMRLAEKKYKYAAMFEDALKMADLYGGCGMIFFIKGQENFDIPLDLEAITKGDLHKIVLLNPEYITKNDPNFINPLADNFLMPNSYIVFGAESADNNFHYTRVSEIDGHTLPQGVKMRSGNFGQWADSRLAAVFLALKGYNQTISAAGNLVAEANIDVISETGAKNREGTTMYDKAIDRVKQLSMFKSLYRILYLDKESTYTRNGISFSGLSNVVEVQQEDVAGAAGIPATRLFGKAKAGMSGDTNDGDIRNYHEKLEHRQVEVKRQFSLADEILVRSTYGYLPDDIDYKWGDLSIISGSELAKIDKDESDTDKNLIEAKVISPTEARSRLENVSRYELDKSEYETWIKEGKKEETKTEPNQEGANDEK